MNSHTNLQHRDQVAEQTASNGLGQRLIGTRSKSSMDLSSVVNLFWLVDAGIVPALRLVEQALGTDYVLRLRERGQQAV